MTPVLGQAYLDYNASAPLWPEAASAAARALSMWGNASAAHSFGRKQRDLIERAREGLAAAVHARPSQIVFTSGGTEANNLALRGLAASGAIERIALSAIEHPSVMESAKQCGVPIEIIPVSAQGAVVLEAVRRCAAPRTLISVMSANNETGVVQPTDEILHIARDAGALVHVDAVQSLGRMRLPDADVISLSAHKIGGPAGVGALVLRTDLTLGALIFGGGQERRRRAGTENLAGIVGFGAACTKLAEIAKDQPRLALLRDRLEQAVLQQSPDAVFFGAGVGRLANTSCFATPGLPATTQLMALDLAGVAVSAGAACSSGKTERSPVLSAMGAGALAGEAIRVSLGWTTTEQHIDLFLNAYRQLIERRAHRAYGT